MIKLIIAGSRSITDFNYVEQQLNNYGTNLQNIEVVSGTANGVDKLGERYADKYSLKVKRFPANWNEYGKSAGYIRNEEMAKYATHCIVFWDGISKGSKHMIDLANKYKLKLLIIKL